MSNWIYTVVIFPLAILFQKHFSSTSRISVLEQKDIINDEKFEKLCLSVDELTKEVHNLIGRIDEHLRDTG